MLAAESGSPVEGEKKIRHRSSSLSSLMALRMNGGELLVSRGKLKSADAVFDSSEFACEHQVADGNVGGVYIVRHKESGKRFVFKPEDLEGFSLTELEDAPSSPSSSSTSSSTTTSTATSSTSLSVRKTNSNVVKMPLRNGVVYGHTSRKEVAAYRLDHDSFSGVPRTIAARLPVPEDVPTRGIKHTKQLTSLGSLNQLTGLAREEGMLVQSHEDLNTDAVVKVGSLQEFQNHLCSAEDMGSGMFSNHQVQKIGILDLRLFNLDRHLGNILVTKSPTSNQLNLVPIDHGYILPDIRDLSDANFEWMYWKQCKEPFTRSALQYIKRLNPRKDALILRSLDIPEPSILTCVTCTLLLQRAAMRGLNLYQIASIMQRSGFRDQPSSLERMVKDALKMVEEMCIAEGATLDEFFVPSHHAEQRSEEQKDSSAAASPSAAAASPKTSPSRSKSGSKTPPNRRSRSSSMNSHSSGNSPSVLRSPTSIQPTTVSEMKSVLEDLPFQADPTAHMYSSRAAEGEDGGGDAGSDVDEDDSHVGSLNLDDLLENSGASEYDKLRQEMRTTKDGLPSVDSMLHFRIDSKDSSAHTSRGPSPPSHQSFEPVFKLDEETASPPLQPQPLPYPKMGRTLSSVSNARRSRRVSERRKKKARKWQRWLISYLDFLYIAMDEAIAEIDAPPLAVPASPMIRILEPTHSPETNGNSPSGPESAHKRHSPPAFSL